MKGRTYRFIEDKPVWPFGFGLSYSRAEYLSAEILSCDDENITLSVKIENKGKYEIDEKIQVYARFTDSRCETPRYQLCAIKPVKLSPGETKTAELNVDRFWIKAVTADGVRREPDGEITLYTGSSQPDELSRSLGAPACVSIKLA